MDSVYEILNQADYSFCALAAEVGVDGAALLNNLPAPGYLMKGNEVPVLVSEYRNTCSVIFYINRTKSGLEWPLVRFYTFKHGGIERTFNGLKWLKEHPNIRIKKPTLKTKTIEKPSINTERLKQENETRELRYRKLQAQAESAVSLSPNHSWVKQRLCGYATKDLLSRTNIKCLSNGRILAPLINSKAEKTGFHQIRTTPEGDEKRHFIRASGLMKGSYIQIAAVQGVNSSTVAICEGLATGLSIALVWPGEIRVALTANNLNAVRNEIPSRAVFFSDEDIWKTDVGNVGRKAALAAIKPEDGWCLPIFSGLSMGKKPTDFNDLLRLEGIEAISEQVFTIL
jgi:phage/plasmid primase-like uncharacterized protein